MSMIEIGKISVDSGMIMISDPCYLRDLKRGYMDKIAETLSPKQGTYEWYQRKIRFDESGHVPADGANVDVFKRGGLAVAMGTMHGDGVYSVMAEVVEDTNPMRIERIVIDFT